MSGELTRKDVEDLILLENLQTEEALDTNQFQKLFQLYTVCIITRESCRATRLYSKSYRIVLYRQVTKLCYKEYTKSADKVLKITFET